MRNTTCSTAPRSLPGCTEVDGDAPVPGFPQAPRTPALAIPRPPAKSSRRLILISASPDLRFRQVHPDLAGEYSESDVVPYALTWGSLSFVLGSVSISVKPMLGPFTVIIWFLLCDPSSCKHPVTRTISGITGVDSTESAIISACGSACGIYGQVGGATSVGQFLWGAVPVVRHGIDPEQHRSDGAVPGEQCSAVAAWVAQLPA